MCCAFCSARLRWPLWLSLGCASCCWWRHEDRAAFFPLRLPAWVCFWLRDNPLSFVGRSDVTLHQRLSEATEGTRELDGDIERVLFPDALIMTDAGQVGIGARPAAYEPIGARADLPGDVIAECTGVSFYTTSLDAALALAERVLPEATFWEVCTPHQSEFEGPYAATISDPLWFDVSKDDWDSHAHGEASGNTPALALCLAILKAKAAARARQGGPDHG